MSIAPCAYLILLATESEEKALLAVAASESIPVYQLSGRAGTYWDFGDLGLGRVYAIRSSIGPFGHRGSATTALLARAETVAAAGVVSVGMCFGVGGHQKLGDVCLATALLPYDERDVESDYALPRYNYQRVRLHRAHEGLVSRVQTIWAQLQGQRAHGLWPGAMLTGGAKIRCRAFRDHLVGHLAKTAGASAIVGGEMEGAGLIGLSPPESGCWVMLKGICDFADESRGTEVKLARQLACENAVRLALDALRSWPIRPNQEGSSS